MRGILRDALLIVLPFAVLSAAFFLGEMPRFGIAFIGVTLLALWYVRPRRKAAADTGSDDGTAGDPRLTAQPGAGSGGAGM